MKIRTENAERFLGKQVTLGGHWEDLLKDKIGKANAGRLLGSLV